MKESKKMLERVTREKEELVRYINSYQLETNRRNQMEEEKSSKLRLSKIESCILEINLAQKIVEDKTEMTM